MTKHMTVQQKADMGWGAELRAKDGDVVRDDKSCDMQLKWDMGWGLTSGVKIEGYY